MLGNLYFSFLSLLQDFLRSRYFLLPFSCPGIICYPLQPGFMLVTASDFHYCQTHIWVVFLPSFLDSFAAFGTKARIPLLSSLVFPLWFSMVLIFLFLCPLFNFRFQVSSFHFTLSLPQQFFFISPFHRLFPSLEKPFLTYL